MTNSTNNISADITINGQKLEVTTFKCLGATLCKVGNCSAEVRIRIASAKAKVNRSSQCNIISFAGKFKLYTSLVTSILLYGCETWTLLADSEKRIQAFETKCPGKLLCIFCLEHKTNHLVRSKIILLVGPQEPLLATGNRRNLAWFGICQTPRQPLQNHPSGHLGGWATPWSVEEMLDGQHEKVDIPAHARTAHKGLLQKRLEEDLC